MRLSLKAWPLLVSLSVLVSCGSTQVTRFEPGTTYGEVYVGFPRVAGRERLVNDRLEQEQWLTEQLKRINEQSLGFDGLSDIRNLAFTSAQLKAQLDPAYKLYAGKQEQALQNARVNAATEEAAQQFRLDAARQIIARFNRQELSAEQAKSELDKIGVKYADLQVGGASGEALTLSPATPAADKNLPGSALFKADGTSAYTPPTGASAGQVGLHGSFIDRFRDLETGREEVRTARTENALDDAHDIDGNTLYRMTFDVSIRPRPDTSALAIVELTVSNPGDVDDADFVDRIRRSLKLDSRNRVDEQWRHIRQKIETECQKPTELFEAIECALSEFNVTDQNYIWKAMYEMIAKPGWKDAKVLRVSDKKSLALSSQQAIKQVLIESEAIRLSEFPAGCYFKIQRPSANPPLEPDFKTQRKKVNLGFGASVSVPVPVAAPRVGRSDVTEVDVIVAYPVRPITAGSQVGADQGAAGCQTSYADEAAFRKAVLKLFPTQTIKSYAVTPRESVQRLSELGGNRAARELLLGLSAIAPGGGVGAALQQITASDAMFQAIRRQPLIVGFNDARGAQQNETHLGWMLGPQFQMSSNGKSVNFRHSPKQQSVSATISAPSWLSKVNICVRTYWLNEAGVKVSADGKASPVGDSQDCPTPALEVALPRRSTTLISQIYDSVLQRGPSTTARQRIDVVEGESARVIISGANLWRSTEVFIGAQKADRLSLTPDMQGIQAIFDRIDSPNGSRVRPDGRYDLTVLTSEGRADAGTVNIIKAAEKTSLLAQGFSRRLIGGQTSTFDLSNRLGPYSSADVYVLDARNVSFAGKIDDIQIAQDERRVSFTAKEAQWPNLKAADLVNVTFKVKRAPHSDPVDIVVAENVYYFPNGDATKVTPTLASPPKQWPIVVNLKVPKGVPESYGAFLSGRPRLSSTAYLDNAELPLKDAVCEVKKGICQLSITADPEVQSKLVDAGKAWTLRLAFADEDSPEIAGTPIQLGN